MPHSIQSLHHCYMSEEMKFVNSLRPRHWPQDKVTPDLPPKVSAYFRYSLNFSIFLIALETLSGSNMATGSLCYTIL